VAGSTTALAKEQDRMTSHHLEVISNACKSMYPSKKIKQIKCRHQMRKKAGPLFNLENIPTNQRERVVIRCEFLKYGGDGEDRLKRYDQCLRSSVKRVAPEKVALPPKLAIKPVILIDSVNCHNLSSNSDEALNTYKIKLKEYFNGHVRKVLFLNDAFMTGFWCKNKTLYFKNAWKKHQPDRKFYTVMLQLEAKNHNEFNLNYELFDIEEKSYLYKGTVNTTPMALSQPPSKIFKQLKNARNQIIHQIIKYDPSN
jgi:hypothetical protein